MSNSIMSEVSITLAQIICNAIHPFDKDSKLGSRLLSAQELNPVAYKKLIDNGKELEATGSFEAAHKLALELISA